MKPYSHNHDARIAAQVDLIKRQIYITTDNRRIIISDNNITQELYNNELPIYLLWSPSITDDDDFLFNVETT